MFQASASNFNENDGLSYVDNDNDRIPIDQQSEFLEALKVSIILSLFLFKYERTSLAFTSWRKV